MGGDLTHVPGRRAATALGVTLTVVVLLMALDLVPVIQWPAVGRRAPEATAEAERAERCMRDAIETIAGAKAAAGIEVPPADAGSIALIGSEWTPLVTTLGALEAKRLSTSPAWASTLAAQIRARGIGPSDLAVASFSGSFPGLNIATACACHALGVELIGFSSVTASTWGATDPGFTWPEMEVRLVRAGIIAPVSAAVSIGGDEDAGLDLDDEGRDLASRIADEAAAALGTRRLAATSLEEAIVERLRVLDLAGHRRAVRLFVNVGGTSASLGRSPAILRIRSGWVPAEPFDLGPGRGLVARMVERGVPVLHLLNIRELALTWGLL